MKPQYTVFCVLTLLLTGCMFAPAPPQPVYYYTLDYRLDPIAELPALAAVVRVDRFSASPPFDSQRIIYADRGLHRNAYGHHHWVSPPGELLAYLTARDLRRSDLFLAVLTPDSPLQATHIVNGWIEEFLEEDTAEQWRAFICVHITLLAARKRDPAESIIFQKTYRARTAANAKTPAGLAEAMSAAVAEVSAALVKDIYTAVAENTHSKL